MGLVLAHGLGSVDTGSWEKLDNYDIGLVSQPRPDAFSTYALPPCRVTTRNPIPVQAGGPR